MLFGEEGQMIGVKCVGRCLIIMKEEDVLARVKEEMRKGQLTRAAELLQL